MATSLGVSGAELVHERESELEDCCCSVFVGCCCEKLVAVAQGQFGNPKELLEAVTRRLVKTAG
jgi:hypothetical protein